MTLRTGTLAVNGVSLFYEDHGDSDKLGLLLIAPGNGTCLYYKALIPHLLAHYRVLTFDRRGFHRSPSLSSPASEDILTTNARDCAAIISHLSPHRRVHAFCSSGNTIIGLGLLQQNSELVDRVILHEPVIPSLLPPNEISAMREVASQTRHAFRQSGVKAANRIVMPHVSSPLDLKALRSSPVVDDLAALPAESWNRYFNDELPAIFQYAMDPNYQIGHDQQIILGHGEFPSSRLPNYGTLRLSDLYGRSIHIFPGGHNGYVTHAAAFARNIIAVLEDSRARL